MYLAIIILPLLGSIASGFFGRKIGVSRAQIITCTAVVTTTILAVLAFFEVGLNNIPVSIEVLRWIDSESLNVSWGFHFDSLTVSMLIPVLIVYLVHIYSIGYMSHDLPKPYPFTLEVKRSGFDFSSIGSLIKRKKSIEKEMSELRLDSSLQWDELKKARATLNLAKHVDDSKNNALKQLKKDYPVFFDEDSNNTTKEGLEQVVDYLNGEYSNMQSRMIKLKTEIEGVDNKIGKSKQLDKQLGESSNVNSILIILIRPFPFFVYLRALIKSALPYFSLSVTISSLLFINFIFPSLDVSCFIQSIIDYTNNLIKYEIAISLPLLLWYFYTYTRKIKKYFFIGKYIIHFIKTSNYIDIWLLLVIFTVIFLF